MIRKLKFPLYGKDRTKCYYEIFFEFGYDEELVNLYLYSKKNNNYTIMEKYLDIFKKYVDDIIDYSDEFFCVSRSNGLKPKLKRINHHLEQVIYNDKVLEIMIYNIKNKKDKDILKNIFSINISQCSRYDEIIDVPLNKSYIRNPYIKHRINESFYFIKNNELFFNIELDKGYIHDYRSEKLYYEHLGKYNINTKERIKLKQDFYKANKESIKDQIEMTVESYKNSSKEIYLSFAKVHNIFYEFYSNYGMYELLVYSKYFNDYTIIEKYLDLVKSFLDDIVDYSDEFICYGREDSMKPILDTMPYYIGRRKYVTGERDEKIYSIKEKKYKDILKENLSFNISECGEEAWIIPIDRKYLRNDERNIWHDQIEKIRFLKDNKVVMVINLDSGEKWCYLKRDVLKQFLDKYNNNSKDRKKLTEEYIKAHQKETIRMMKVREEYYRKEYSKYVKK